MVMGRIEEVARQRQGEGIGSMGLYYSSDRRDTDSGEAKEREKNRGKL